MIHFDTYPDVLTIAQLAVLLNVSEKKVYELVRNNEIKSFRLGRQIRICKKDVLAFIS